MTVLASLTTKATATLAAATLAASAAPVSLADENTNSQTRKEFVVASLIHDAGNIRVIRAISDAKNATVATESLAQITKAPTTIDDRVHLLTTNDPLAEQQWALPAHLFDQAWAQSTGSGITVAVLDTGVDASHPDLQGRVLEGKNFVADTAPIDDNGHGTHVAGAIAAITGNATGISGAASGARILPVKVLDASGSGWDSDVAAGIIWAADNGADIINISLGGTADPLTEQAVNYATQAGAVVVAAAGNSRRAGNDPVYPAAYPSVLAVAAAENETFSANYSNTGDYIDITAAGSGIVSTYPGGQYATLSGTSMAAPYVSAAAALLLSSDANLSGADAVGRLTGYARDIEAPGKDNATGHGMLNAQAALCQCATEAPAPTRPDPVDVPDTGSPLPDLPMPELPELPDGEIPSIPTPTLPRLPTPPVLAPGTGQDPSDVTAPVIDTPITGSSLKISIASEKKWITPGADNQTRVLVTQASTGQALPGAVVTLTGQQARTARTDSTGVATITHSPKRTTRYLVQVTDTSGVHNTYLDSHTVWVAPKVTITRKGRKLDAEVHHPNFQYLDIVKKTKKGDTSVFTHLITPAEPKVTYKLKANSTYVVKISPSAGLIAVRSEPVTTRGSGKNKPR